MITYAQFIGAMPEFNNFGAYPKGQVDFWIGQSVNQLSQTRFGNNLDFATMLFVAHNLVLSRHMADEATGDDGENDGIPGESSGPITNKSVGSVSVGFAPSLTAIAGAGPWNYTSYGQRLYKMIRIAGSGGAYVGNQNVGRWRGLYP
jgi:Protein of unknown function (DUF4054)